MMLDSSSTATQEAGGVDEVFSKIHDAINQACNIAEVTVDNPYRDWTSGARLYLDFCAIAMRRAQPKALSDPHGCAGEIRRARICLKKIEQGIGKKKFPQAVLDAANRVNAELDVALVELRAARKLVR